MANPNRSAAIDKQIATLKAATSKKVEAGWFESDRYGGTKGNSVGVPVAKIARIMEFGAEIERSDTTIIIPSRPFMRGAWSAFRAARKQVQTKMAKQLIEKKITSDQYLAQIGLLLEGFIAKSIKNGGWQKNADPTVAKKGFDKPLIDTGHMLKTVNSKVS
jgi:hypothetical protein